MKIEVGPSAPPITETAVFSFCFSTMPMTANTIPKIPAMIPKHFSLLPSPQIT